MPTRLCLTAGCPNPATYRGRCPQHNRTTEQSTRRAGRHIYNTKRWQQTRRAVLFDQPLCPCGELATDVHHIVDLDDNGDPWAMSNLEALCHPCHSRITRRNQAA